MPSNTNNATLYNDYLSPMIKKTITEEDSSLIILSFGHQNSGKTYSILGQNNFQLHKSITDVPISASHDSRGSILRTIADIREKDP